uniref:Uncharacterized protein n=1 Tax=Thermosporothrix sp. COM3 TaxID=2490863 RepID=A0A455SHW3_9CHLR|nr:hypothetical protein KTC_20770 [Thermosporothrix sp. COM3]
MGSPEETDVLALRRPIVYGRGVGEAPLFPLIDASAGIIASQEFLFRLALKGQCID